MRASPRARDVFYLLVPVAIAMAGLPACGSSNDQGGACDGLPVWNAASLSFTLTSSGGFVVPPPADAGCTAGAGVSFDFSLPAATLTEMSCSSSGRIDRVVHLSAFEVASVVGNVRGVRARCATTDCFADVPDTKLTVSASGTQTTYTSDLRSGCTGMVMPPFVSDESFGALVSALHGFVARACAADGGATDAGACMNR